MRLSLNTLGAILGVCFSIVYATFSLVSWHEGVDAYVAFLPYATFVWAPLVVAILVGAGLIWRKGPLSFKDAVKYSFLAFIVYELGYAVANVVIYDVLDKGFNHQVTLVSLQNLAAKSSRLGLSTDQINDNLAKEKASPSGPMGFLQLALGFGQGLLWDFVKCMIVALVIQRKPTAAPAAPAGEQPASAAPTEIQ